MDWLNAAVSGLGAVLGYKTAKDNRKSQEAMNQQNLEVQQAINQENLSYAREQNEITRQREDTSLQRGVADAQAAGLSPLAAISTGGAQTSSPLNYNAQSSIGVAPQMDVSQMLASIASFADLEERKREFDLTHKEVVDARMQQWEQFSIELQRDYDFRLRDDEIALMQDKTDAKKIQLERDKLTESVNQFNSNLLLQRDLMTKSEKEFKANYNLQLSKNSLDDYKNICNVLGFAPTVKYTSDYKMYLNGQTAFNAKYAKVLKDSQKANDIDNADVVSSSTSIANNSSSGVSGGLGASVAGTGANVNLSRSSGDGTSKSNSFSYDLTRKKSIDYMYSLKDVPYYVYVPYGKD